MTYKYYEPVAMNCLSTEVLLVKGVRRAVPRNVVKGDVSVQCFFSESPRPERYQTGIFQRPRSSQSVIDALVRWLLPYQREHIFLDIRVLNVLVPLECISWMRWAQKLVLSLCVLWSSAFARLAVLFGCWTALPNHICRLVATLLLTLIPVAF